MLKRFLGTAILGLLFMSSQIVSAAPPIDWNEVQQITSKTDLKNYIEKKRREGETTIPVILTNGLKINISDFIILCPSSVVSPDIHYNDGKTTRVIYTLMDYPGTRVANAYINGDTIWLTAEEKKLYDKAVEIVNEAKKKSGVLNQEIYIYEQIMSRSQYLTGDMSVSQQRFTTATGVLLDGKANCQGYTDAFYLLGRMMGWNVEKMGGNDHVWNTIEFGDGKIYCVDVTWGDESLTYNGGKRERTLNSYIYLNAPADIMSATHKWDRSFEPANLQPSIDNRYSYYETSSHLRHLSNAEAGLKLIAKKIATEKLKWFSVMVPYDERYNLAHKKQVMDYLEREFAMLRLPTSTVFWTNIKEVGKYLFITVDVFNP